MTLVCIGPKEKRKFYDGKQQSIVRKTLNSLSHRHPYAIESVTDYDLACLISHREDRIKGREVVGRYLLNLSIRMPPLDDPSQGCQESPIYLHGGTGRLMPLARADRSATSTKDHVSLTYLLSDTPTPPCFCFDWIGQMKRH